MAEQFLYMPQLETRRLLLRKLTSRDAEAVFEYSRDPLVAEHVLWDPHRSVWESRSYIRGMQRRYRNGEPSSWGIARKTDDKVIGTIGFMWIQPDHACAEVGYSLARDQWNRGYMTEALRAVIRYGFEDMGLHRIEAIYEVGNPASGAVMRKCGMRHEGTLRDKIYNKGHYVDVELYAILRGEDFLG